MLNQIVNGIMPIIVQTVITILGLLISILVNVAISYLNSKKQQLIASIGIQKYNADYGVAKAVFFAVEQQFKGQLNAALDKRKAFDALILSKIPYLTQDEIDHFRESIAGEINNQLKNSQLISQAAVQQSLNNCTDKK